MVKAAAKAGCRRSRCLVYLLHSAAITFVLLSTLTAQTVPPPPTAAQTDLAFGFTLSHRNLDEGLWGSLDDQFSFGFQVDFGRKWIHHAFSFLGSEKGGCSSICFGRPDSEGSIFELSYGVMFSRFTGKFQPYIGGGISFISAEVDWNEVGRDFSDDDTSSGWYIAGGLAWKTGSNLMFGIDVRQLRRTEIQFGPDMGDADYLQFGVLFRFTL